MLKLNFENIMLVVFEQLGLCSLLFIVVLAVWNKENGS